MVRVRVPATTANLGPGFDAMGMAFDWADELSVEPADELVVEVSGEGAHQVPLDERHLVVRTLRRGLAEFGHPDPGTGLHLRAHNTIPHSRGLGSSASAIAAGYGLAWGLAHPGEPLDRDAVLELVAADEGHPDNAAAAVHGGAVLAWRRTWRDSTGVVQLVVDPRVRARVWVPDVHLPTAQARAMLPEGLPREHVVAQASRAALLVHALAHDPDELLEATQDWLHQTQRGPGMPASLDLVTRLREAGVAAVVSGAGPTVLALGTSEHLAAADTVAHDGFAERAVEVGPGMELLHS